MITVLAEGRDTNRSYILNEDTTFSLFRVHTFVTTTLLHIHILNLTYFVQYWNIFFLPTTYIVQTTMRGFHRESLQHDRLEGYF